MKKILLIVGMITLISCTKESFESDRVYNTDSSIYLLAFSATYIIDSFDHNWKLVKSDTNWVLHGCKMSEGEVAVYRTRRDSVCGKFKIDRWLVGPACKSFIH